MIEESNNSCLCKELDLPFMESEVNVAVSNLNSKSAPDLDQIHYKVISSLPNEYLLTSTDFQ